MDLRQGDRETSPPLEEALSERPGAGAWGPAVPAPSQPALGPSRGCATLTRAARPQPRWLHPLLRTDPSGCALKENTRCCFPGQPAFSRPGRTAGRTQFAGSLEPLLLPALRGEAPAGLHRARPPLGGAPAPRNAAQARGGRVVRGRPPSSCVCGGRGASPGS